MHRIVMHPVYRRIFMNFGFIKLFIYFIHSIILLDRQADLIMNILENKEFRKK